MPESQAGYERAYKACLNCRRKKQKCVLTAEEYTAGRPCAKCRRELKQCVFPPERFAPRQFRRGSSNTHRTNGTPQSPRSPPSTMQPQVTPSPQLPFESSDANLPSLSSFVETRGNGSGTVGSQGLTAPMMRTVVASGDDALGILFEAAQSQNSGNGPGLEPRGSLNAGSSIGLGLAENEDALRAWNACRFTRMGWFSAEEAILYMDLFYRNLFPFTPIATARYRDHSQHPYLVMSEPFLCCVLLTISSRYHPLPGAGGISRGYLIHERLWTHCQHLILRILLGQEKGSVAMTRTRGSVEALLLLTEWHPRSLHFPPPNDGWDSDVILTNVSDLEQCNSNTSRQRWVQDVIQPARRSGRMSWMLAGCALSLANELRIFDSEAGKDNSDGTPRSTSTTSYGEYESQQEQCLRLRRLLYLYMEQLALRLGFQSLTPQSLNHMISVTQRNPAYGLERDWSLQMTAWVELTRLAKSVSEMLFPSKSHTNHILRNGRYVALIEHFQPILSSWKERYLDGTNPNNLASDIIRIEYHNICISTNSLGIQAIVERKLSSATSSTSTGVLYSDTIDSADHKFAQEVIDGSLQILHAAIQLAERKLLAYSPVRLTLRITTASIFLLKGLSLGVSATNLKSSLDVLTRCIAALRSSAPDDVHLGASYATLLELHVDRLRASFVPATRPPDLVSRPASSSLLRAEQTAYDGQGTGAQVGDVDGMPDVGMSGNEWLTLPMNPAAVPWDLDDMQGWHGLGDSDLDFLWELDRL